ncbi:MAG: hypothetical protein IPP98_07930 [Gemmatimonadetes bacterium]|nr:hypothetical protein [Gemmatimonadota bacterium]
MTAPPPVRSQSSYFWLCLALSATVFYGFSITYFQPMLVGAYPESSATVHLHGWTFFLYYLLLPLQACLIRARRVEWHRALGTLSLGLAAAMVGTGMVVIGTQMNLSLQPDGSPFWQGMGPAVFATLILFVIFYTRGILARRDRDRHRRFMLLASAGGMGAAGFRVMTQVLGFTVSAGVVGILVPNLFIVAAILIDRRRGRPLHPVYRTGLPLSVGLEVAAFLVTPTPIGRVLAEALGSVGRALAPLY